MLVIDDDVGVVQLVQRTLENRFPDRTIAGLEKLGHEVEVLGAYEEAMGHAGALIRRSDGLLEGGFDPRSDGGVAAW